MVSNPYLNMKMCTKIVLHVVELSSVTTRKSINTNGNTEGIFL